jgi:hypothetical protein
MNSSRPERGIALLSVVMVLVALILIAIPFAISMKGGRDRTHATVERQRAAHEAEQIVRAVASWLHLTHPAYETRVGKDGEENYDSLDEVTPPASYRQTIEGLWPRSTNEAIGARAPSISDPRGSIWTWRVTDQNALVNPNGASPYLVANLLGAALLSEDLDASATTIAVVPDTVASLAAPGASPFRKDGGFVRIGREVVRYASFDPMTGFKGCERGALRGGPIGENGSASEHKKGAPVLDYAAWKIATHLVAARPGELTGFRTLEDLRSIRLWGDGGDVETERLQPLLPFLTLWSRRVTAETFLAGQTIMNALPEGAAGDGEILRLRDKASVGGHTAYLNPGTHVRLFDGDVTHYDVVAVAGDEKGKEFGTAVTLSGRLPEGVTFEGGRATVSPLAPFPVNLNTAPREVLVACFSNLHLRDAGEREQIVTPKKAHEVVDLLLQERAQPLSIESSSEGKDRVAGPFRDARDFGKFLERLEKQQKLTFQQRKALYVNAVNPHDDSLAFGTAPFCYRTLDVYAIEARAIVNDSSGEKAAEAARREVVQIGADAATEWTLDTQGEFEEGLSLGSGGKFITTYPNNASFVSDRDAHVEPRRRPEQAITNGIYPEREPSRDDGVRLEAARIRLPGATFRDHQDKAFAADGWSTQLSGAFSIPVKGPKGLRGDDAQDPYVHPFSLSFWWRPHEDSNWFAFDTGKDEFQNRIALFVRDGDQGRELVFRVCDGTIQKAGAEITVPLTQLAYSPETWYHLHVSARGCDPTQMELLVDGIAMGKRRGVGYLSSGLSTTQTDIGVEPTAGFDAENGALLIGDEIVEYESFGVDGFSKCRRGRRGTTARDWPEGTAVVQAGYSHPLLLELRKGGASLPQQEWEKFYAVELRPKDEKVITFTTSAGVTVTVMGVEEDTEEFEADLVLYGPDGDAGKAGSSLTLAQVSKTFQDQGYALLCAPEIRDSASNEITPPPPPEEPGGGGPVTGGATVSAPADGGAGAPAAPGRRAEGARRLSARDDDGGGGPRMALATGPKVGGFDIVYYRMNGRGGSQPSMTITRYQTTAWRTTTEQFIMPTALAPNYQTAVPFGTYLVPISFLAQGGIGDYLNPAPGNPDTAALERYPTGTTDLWSRVAIGGEKDGDDDVDNTEVIVYNSIERQKTSPYLCFRHDREGDLASTFDRFPKFFVGAPPGGPVSKGGLFAVAPVPAAPSLGGGSGLAGGILAATPADDPPPRGPGGSVPPGLRPPSDPAPAPVPAPTPPPAPPPTEPPAPDPGGGSPPGGSEGTDWSNMPSAQDLSNLLHFRGQNGTTIRKHLALPATDPDARVLPCFRTLLADKTNGRRTGGPKPGRTDLVTLTTEGEAPEREERTVRWSDGGSNWMALDDFIEREMYGPSADADASRQDYRGLTRVSKFPSGELPDEHSETIDFGKSAIEGGATAVAYLDEVHLFRHERFISLGQVVNSENLSEETDTIGLIPVPPATTLVGIPGHREACGLLDYDGELIAYRGSHTEGSDILVLEGCVRGVLGTKPRNHATRGYARLIPNVPITYLAGDLAKDGAAIGTAKLHKDDWPREGLVRIVGQETVELVHFTGRTDEGLIVPEAIDADASVSGRGLLRGRFGTEAISHESGELVVWQPFRVWDRYMPQQASDRSDFNGVHDHPEACYLELAKTVYGAYWHQARWVPNLDGRSDDVAREKTGDRRRSPDKHNLIVLARFDPSVSWETTKIVDLRGSRPAPPTLDARPQPGMLYVLDDPEGLNAFGFEADSAEFRVFFQFLPGCFEPMDVGEAAKSPDERQMENAWKMTPWLRSFTVEYQNGTKSLYQAHVR